MAFIGKGKPGGPGGNKVAGGVGGDPIRKSRPASSLMSNVGESTASKGSKDDATRKARPKSTGSGQSTATK